MSTLLGTRLGPYEVISALGAGGMGEVYLARDPRIDRTVAIKVLPSHLANNPDLRQRLDREARAIASLNHPNICALYDVGHQDGIDYLVMEYLEGESLAKVLQKGPVPTPDLLRIAMQVADALDKAHRQGLVHRDLKPGNIVITKNGAKLLDFGLAKWQAAEVAQDLSVLTRTSSPLTGEGTIVGTFQYMSPEQLEGREADSRSDLFSFGVVLYEMATGRRPFEGKSQASLIASIMKEEPRPISALQPMTPPALERVVKQCLAKEPDDRWQTAGDLKRELTWITQSGSQAGIPVQVSVHRKRQLHLSWIVAAVAIVAASALAAMQFMQPVPEKSVQRFALAAPGNDVRMEWPKISPDGKSLAFLAFDSLGNTSIHVRPMNSLEAHPLPGTEGAGRPFWSPDSRYLAFFTGKHLKKIPAAGGPAQLVCETIGFDGSWGTNGIILYDNAAGDSIRQVPAAGGIPTAATSLGKDTREILHAWPFFLPDGNRFLFLVQTDSATQTNQAIVRVGSLDGKISKDLLTVYSRIEYSPAGYILHVQGGVLLAQPFDQDNLELSGEPIPLAENVAQARGAECFSVAENGTLVYQTGAVIGNSSLIWLDREGKVLDTLGAPAPYRDIELSPDGTRLAFGMLDERAQTDELWIYDLTREVPSRLTFSDDMDIWPKWSPDGTRILYTTNSTGSYVLKERLASGVGEPKTLLAVKGNVGPSDVSSDGKVLALSHQQADWDVWLLNLADSGKYTELTNTQFLEFRPRISPNGRYIAYQSNESGRWEIYVREASGTGGKWQVSNHTGVAPMWRADGKEIFYVSQSWDMMAVPVETESASFSAGIPNKLFNQRYANVGLVQSRYAVTRDGQRFLVNVPVSVQNTTSMIVTLNWDAELRQHE